MKVSWRTEWPQWLLLAGMFLAAALTWNHAPDRMPVHWGFNGQPDRFGGRFEGLVVPPLIALGIYLLLLVAPRIDPGRANYPSFIGAYNVIRVTVLVVIAGVDVFIHLWIRNNEINTRTLMAVLFGALFIVLGNVMGKLRPNWFIGIRTPWTLSSKQAWTKTHRVGGWLFVLLGMAMLGAGLIGTAWAFVVAMALLVGITLGLSVYSYILWKNDPDKTPPAGTLPA